MIDGFIFEDEIVEGIGSTWHILPWYLCYFETGGPLALCQYVDDNIGLLQIDETINCDIEASEAVFGPSEARWYYTYTAMLSHGYIKYEVSADTTINNQPYRILEMMIVNINVLTEDIDTSYSQYYFHSDPVKAYLYNGTDFGVLYDFSLEQGDTYSINFGPEHDPVEVQVVMTGTIWINYDPLRFYDIISLNLDNSDAWFIEGRVIERIGNTGQNLLGNNGLDEFGGSGFRCYHDYFLGNVFAIGYSYWTCDDIWTGVSEIESPVQMTLFPNPVSDILQFDFEGIKGDEIRGMSVYNSSGKCVLEKKLPGGTSELQVNVYLFPPGIYTVKLQLSSRAIITGRFCKM